MLTSVILFVLGFVILIKGADAMVEGASSIAKKYGISSFVIGLTIIAFGTSMPELVVSLFASIKGNYSIALGNIIGSNITNTLLILGVSAMIYPLIVKKSTTNKEIPFSLLSVLALGILVNDFLIDGRYPDGLSRIDGLILILFFAIFAFYTFGISRSQDNIFEKIQGEIKDEPKEYKNYISAMMILAGAILLFFGGRWIVNGAVEIGRFYGMSEELIALTIVAMGTSLPELAASMTAAYKRKTDIAVGNVVGSNIFNFLWVMGISATIHPIGYDISFNIDLLFLFFVTFLLMFLIYVGKKNVLGRLEGGVLVSLYFVYLIFLIFKG